MSGRFNLNDYVTVDERIDRFWEQYPDGAIRTELSFTNNEGTSVAIRATVHKQASNALPDATGFAQESQTASGDRGPNRASWWENCETSAIGRALANLGMSISKQRPSRQEMSKVQRVQEDDDGNAASKPAQRPTGQQRYDHARQHGKDPVTNDAPMWGDIEDAMADDARRYAQRLANGATAAQSNGSAPTRPTTPAAQSAPQTPATPQTNRPPEGWTTVWTEAKAQGIKDRAALEEFMGVAPGAPLDTAAVLRQLRGQSAPSAPRHEVS